MKKLEIEWRHYDKDGSTCDRCSTTGSALSEVVREISQELAAEGVQLVFNEVALPEEAMEQSNLVLINGVRLEELLDDATSSENSCHSCSCLTGKDTKCRTVEYQGKTHEEIPADMIRLAVYRSLRRG